MTVRRVRIGDVLELQRRPVEIDSLAEYVAIGVRSFGKGIFHYPPTPGNELSKLRFFEIVPDELVLSNIKAWEGAIAVSSAAEQGVIGSNRFLSYRPVGDEADVSYLRFFLLSEAGLPLIQRASPGSADRNRTLAIERFEALKIPLPTIEEQERTATRLVRQLAGASKLDEKLSARGSRVKALLESRVRHVFGRLSGPRRRLGVDIVMVSGATPATHDPSLWDGEIAWTTPSDLGALNSRDLLSTRRQISEAGYESSSTRTVPPGSVILSTRAPIGHLAIARVPTCTNQGCKSFLTPNDMLPEYLYYALMAQVAEFRAAGTGTTFTEISGGRLSAFTVPFVDEDRQRSIVEHLDGLVDRVDRSSGFIRASTLRTKALRASILNSAFSGVT